MKKPQHTPTPWSYTPSHSFDKRHGNYIRAGEVRNGAAVPPAIVRLVSNNDSIDGANAAFIVRVVNAHEQMTEDFKKLLEIAEILEKNHANDLPMGIATLNYFRKALAKAEGKE